VNHGNGRSLSLIVPKRVNTSQTPQSHDREQQTHSRYPFGRMPRLGYRVIVQRNRLAWPHRRRELASDGVRYADARSSVGCRVRRVAKLRLEWYVGFSYRCSSAQHTHEKWLELLRHMSVCVLFGSPVWPSPPVVGSRRGSSPLFGSAVGGDLPCRVPVSCVICSSSCLSLALTLSQCINFILCILLIL